MLQNWKMKHFMGGRGAAGESCNVLNYITERQTNLLHVPLRLMNRNWGLVSRISWRRASYDKLDTLCCWMLNEHT